MVRKLSSVNRTIAISLLLALFTPPLSGQAVDYLPVFDSLRNLSLRTDSAASVRDVSLVRDSLTFRLDSGIIYFTGSVVGRAPGAVFVGRGWVSVAVAPAYDVERRELHRVLRDSSTTWPITAAAFLALDSTVAELRARARAWHASQDAAAGRVLDHLLSHLFDDRSKLARDGDFLSGVLNADTTGFLLARVARAGGEDLTLRYDVRAQDGITVLHDAHENAEWPVASFPITRALSDSEPDMVSDPDVRLGRYTIDAAVDPMHDFSSATVLRFTTPRIRTRWVEFELAEMLHADSLTEQGRPVPFFQAPHNGNLWIRLLDGRQPGDTITVRLVDHGKLIDTYSLLDVWRRDMPRIAPEISPDKWFQVRDCAEWYPRYGSRQVTDMDLTYRVPRNYQFSSIGRLTDSTRSGDTVITHWRTERPTAWACFNVGRMEERHIADSRIPPVVVQMNTEAHKSLDQFLEALTDSGGAVSNLRLLTRANALEDVSGDVTNSLSFFAQRFGAPLYSRYYATEVPVDYGEAFPGMIYLSNYTYIGQRNTGAEEIFRSHEMAHQWWGIGVMPASERDVWLAEGFAEFSALWYMQHIMRDTSKFYDQIGKWRDELVSRGSDVAPLGIGFRVQDQDHPKDYDLIVYEKGAWVLQMLRNLMLNFGNFNEDGFTVTMRDFYTRYRGRKASIRDFQRVVEEHTQESMGWFFDEWVYGSAIPTYTFSWQVDTAVNGKIPLHLRVRQTDVPDGFFMPVPVELQFAGGRHAYIHLNVRGPLTEGTISLPEAPTAVYFNPLASVLAKVKTERWKR